MFFFLFEGLYNLPAPVSLPQLTSTASSCSSSRLAAAVAPLAAPACLFALADHISFLPAVVPSSSSPSSTDDGQAHLQLTSSLPRPSHACCRPPTPAVPLKSSPSSPSSSPCSDSESSFIPHTQPTAPPRPPRARQSRPGCWSRHTPHPPAQNSGR